MALSQDLFNPRIRSIGSAIDEDEERGLHARQATVGLPHPACLELDYCLDPELYPVLKLERITLHPYIPTSLR